MAQNPKILSQAFVTGGQPLTGFYIVPTGNTAVISSVVICNLYTGDIRVSLKVARTGETDNAKHYIFKDVAIAQYDTLIGNGLTMSGFDQIRGSISTSLGSGAFSAWGVEISP